MGTDFAYGETLMQPTTPRSRKSLRDLLATFAAARWAAARRRTTGRTAPPLAPRAGTYDRSWPHLIQVQFEDSGIVILASNERMYVACGKLYCNGLSGGSVLNAG